MQLHLVKRQPETHDTETFYWQPDQPIEYQSGQYLRWTLEHQNPDDRGINRFFTISSSPSEPLLSNTTKFNTERSSSFKKALRASSIGQSIKATGPHGKFILPDDLATPVVLVAGGIGVTPYRSMIKFMFDRQQKRPIKLIYAVRTDQDITFKAELEAMAPSTGLSIDYVFETPPPGWTGPSGRLDGPKILELTGKADQLIYLSGPEPMIEAFESDLVEHGQSKELIKTDFFPNYTKI